MRIALTGGSGFLGSRLMVELRGRGHECVSWDRATGMDLSGSSYLRLYEAFSWKPDLVVHLAASPGRLFCEDDPVAAVAQNAGMTTLVAKVCGEMDVRLAYVSTSEVYGPQEGLVTELFPPRPVNIYGMTKYWGEQVARLYAPSELVILRPTMPYGPDMAVGYGRAMLPTLIANALAEKPSIVHLNTSRSWCFVEDTVRGMADVVERGTGVYNIGRDDDLRPTTELARMVYETLGADPSLLTYKSPDWTVTAVKNLSCARLRDLGWEPKVSLREGIRLTAESLRERLAA